MRAVTSMGVMEFQDYTFEINDGPDRRLTDEQLLAEWKKQFPGQSAEVFTGDTRTALGHVRSIRLLYNRGTQGHGRRDESGRIVGKPTILSLPYDSTGKPFSYSRRWLDSALDGRTPLQAGVSTEAAATIGLHIPETPAIRPVKLALHERYRRADVFSSVGIEYTPQKQDLNVGFPSSQPSRRSSTSSRR